VGNDYNRASASVRGIAQNVEDAISRLDIKRPCGFVRQYDGGLSDERPGNRNSLLLSPREVLRPAIFTLLKANQAKRFGSRSSSFATADSVTVPQRELYISVG
jgi:hypothetical protein